jgi:GNAT superfamily N-acetyltransferase
MLSTPSGFPVLLANSDEEIARCFDVMAELRLHLSRETFLARIRRQMTTGYQLAFLLDGGAVISCAGFRFMDTLAWGKVLYVDDLITAERVRGRGFGARMMGWLVERALQENCDELHLDSGTGRLGAHKFYFRHGMVVKSFHFSRELTRP